MEKIFIKVDKTIVDKVIKDTLRPILSQDHHYILGLPISRAIFSSESLKCYEKAEALGWPLSRIIKTLYYSHKDKIVGVVLDASSKVKQKKLAPVLGISYREAERLQMADKYPTFQKPGSLSPFITQYDLGLLEKIIFTPSELVSKDLVDFSLPSIQDDYVSLHTYYSEVYDLIKRKFRDKIIIEDVLKRQSL